MVRKLLGRLPPRRRAILEDHRRVHDVKVGYYSVKASPGERVEGFLLEGLSAEEVRVLDGYEEVAGGLYRRQTVEVVVEGRRVAAEVYMTGG